MRNYSYRNAVNTVTRLCAAILRMQIKVLHTVHDAAARSANE